MDPAASLLPRAPQADESHPLETCFTEVPLGRGVPGIGRDTDSCRVPLFRLSEQHRPYPGAANAVSLTELLL